MGFHRLAVPSYFGGLPGGYDYINNATSGTPAQADGPRSDGGPNNGTYYIGFGEDARTRAWNRGLKALSENCDVLDDYLHRSIAIPEVTSLIISAGDTSVIIPGPAFVGVPGTPNTVDGIRTFVMLVDEFDNEIYNGANECEVTAISGASVGDEWSAGSVTLTVSPAIPASVNYRVYYYSRGNLATAVPDFTFKEGRKYNKVNASPAWADGETNPATYVERQFHKIITDLVDLAGAARLGAAATAGTPFALTNGTIRSQLDELLAQMNAYFAELRRVRTLSSAGTLNTPSNDSTILLNPGGGAFNLSLPDPTTCGGQQVNLINNDGLMSLTNKVTLVRFGGEKINGLTNNYELRAAWGKWKLVCDGTDWHVMTGS
jgi:hypothetical protein